MVFQIEAFNRFTQSCLDVPFKYMFLEGRTITGRTRYGAKPLDSLLSLWMEFFVVIDHSHDNSLVLLSHSLICFSTFYKLEFGNFA